MAETFVQLPTDAANTGKKVRAMDRVVGANTTLEHFMILQDYGSDTQGKIKAASTAAIATDPSLVVALSPNTALPAGSNAIGSVAINAALPTGTNTIGSVKLTDGTNTGTIKAASTAAIATDTSQVVALSPNTPLPAGANVIGSANAIPPTLTKGSQGATGFSTQDLKDAGRTQFSAATVIAGVAGVAAEALLSMVPLRDGVAGGAATTFAVTAAKRMRLTHVIIGFVSTAAAVVSVRCALRTNPGGAAIVTSPIVFIIPVPSGAALAQAGGVWSVEIPDGIEFSGTQQWAITHIGSVATYTLWVSIIGFEY
jgi:hypothetical protein